MHELADKPRRQEQTGNHATHHDSTHSSACPGLYRMPNAADGGLCRIKLEQGRITPQQWRAVAQAASDYGNGIIEITTRANIQLRGVTVGRAQYLSAMLEGAGFAPKARGGDDVRNVMINPTAGFDQQGDKRVLNLAQDISTCLQTVPRYQTLSPKFSLFLDGGEHCAVLHHVHDIWLALCDEGQKFAFGLASRPPLVGETRAVQPALGKVPFDQAKPLIFALIDCLLEQRDEAPELSRMKHLLHMIGNPAIIHYVKKKGVSIEKSDDFYRQASDDFLYLGIHESAYRGRFYLGLKAALGRLTPRLCRLLADYGEERTTNEPLRLTPWQGMIFPDCSFDEAVELEKKLQKQGFITNTNQSLARIICCSGLTSCAAAKADTRADATSLGQILDGKIFSLTHVTGCAKSCAANEAAPATLVALDSNHYDLYTKDAPAPSPFGRKIASGITIETAAKFLLCQAQ